MNHHRLLSACPAIGVSAPLAVTTYPATRSGAMVGRAPPPAPGGAGGRPLPAAGGGGRVLVGDTLRVGLRDAGSGRSKFRRLAVAHARSGGRHVLAAHPQHRGRRRQVRRVGLPHQRARGTLRGRQRMVDDQLHHAPDRHHLTGRPLAHDIACDPQGFQPRLRGGGEHLSTSTGAARPWSDRPRWVVARRWHRSSRPCVLPRAFIVTALSSSTRSP